jgi:hypothetical protein
MAPGREPIRGETRKAAECGESHRNRAKMRS